MKRKIFLLLDSRGMGGVETHVRTLATSLHSQGDEVVVVFWQRYGAHPMIPDLVNEGISFRHLGGSFFALLKLLRRYPQAVLHTHGYKANLVGRVASGLMLKRSVSTFHNGDLGEGKLRLYTWLDLVSAFMSRNIAVSQEISQRIVAKSRLIPNYVRLPTLYSRSEQQVIAFVGRLEQVKRADKFIDLARSFPEREFHIYGEGSQRARLQEIAPPNVKFLGFVSTMERRWRGIELLVICSDTEGLPLCALEAMSNEVPVVARPVGDLPAVINGESGFIADTHAQMAQAIKNWETMTAAQKQSMRSQARNTIAENYSEARCLAALVQEYC